MKPNKKYLKVSNIARNYLDTDAWRASFYTGIDFDGDGVNTGPYECMGYPNLGKGLRFKGNTNVMEKGYEELRIHVDDIEAFVSRYKAYQAEKAQQNKKTVFGSLRKFIGRKKTKENSNPDAESLEEWG